MNIILTKDESAVLMQPVEGQGGWQSLLRRLQAAYDPATGVISVADADLDRLRSYCTDYGDGGWQKRVRQVFGRTLGPGLNI